MRSRMSTSRMKFHQKFSFYHSADNDIFTHRIDVQLIVGGRWKALNFTLTLHYSFLFNSSPISTRNRFHEWSSIHTTRRRRWSESKLFNFQKISSFSVQRELSRVDSRYPNSCRARPRVMIIVQQPKKKSNFIVINGQLSWTPLCLWWTHIESARDRERQTRSCCVSFKISTERARALSSAKCF